jgi:hypothetical protein
LQDRSLADVTDLRQALAQPVVLLFQGADGGGVFFHKRHFKLAVKRGTVVILWQMQTPFFPAFRARLAPMGRRVLHLRQQSLCHLELLLRPFLPPGLLAQADEGPNSRERVFSLRRTFFGFLYQVLKPDTPCREIVRQIQALFALHDRGRVDENSSAYCQARKRLPLDTLQRLRVAVAAAGEKTAALWHRLRPKVIDGTTVSLADTPKNQRAYPQLRTQKPGCGLRKGKRLGKNDRLFTWLKPRQKPRWLPQSWWTLALKRSDPRVLRESDPVSR